VAGHSLSEVQPDSTGAAVGNKHVLNNAWQKWGKVILLILSHRTSPFPVKPKRHVQVMVLRGRVSYTLQSAFSAQGFNWVQGFLQSPARHASLLGQSPSSLHPSSIWGSGTKNEYGHFVTAQS
jgi:hypothetical protein